MNWTRAKSTVWEELDGGAVVVNTETRARWSLNATATAVWKLCSGELNLDKLASAVARPRREIADFCQRFAELGLLSPSASGATLGVATFQTPLTGAPTFKALGLGSGPRRRPNPSGISGPA